VLLGGGLLVVALVGQGVAAAHSQDPSQTATLPTPAGSQWPGQTPAAIRLEAHLQTGTPLGGPQPPAAGVQPDAAVAGDLPARPDRLTLEPPHWWQGVSRRGLLLAHGLVMTDLDEPDSWSRGQAAPPGTVADSTLIVAQATGTPPSVSDVLGPVVQAANKLSSEARPLGGERARSLPGDAKAIDKSASQAKLYENWRMLPQSREQMNATLALFDQLIHRTDVIAHNLGQVGVQLQWVTDRDRDASGTARLEARRGQVDADPAGRNPGGYVYPAAVLAYRVRTQGEGFMNLLQPYARDRVDKTTTDLLASLKQHEQAAQQLEEAGQRSQAYDEVKAAADDFDRLVEHLKKEVAAKLGTDSDAIRALARDATTTAATAKAEAQRLRADDAVRQPQPRQQDTLLDDPAASPDDPPLASAGAGDPDLATRAAAERTNVAPAGPGVLAQEPGPASSDATVAQTLAQPPAAPVATLVPEQAASHPAPPTTPTPLVEAGTGATLSNSGWLSADNPTESGDQTGMLVSNTDTDNSSTTADASDPLGNGFLGGSLVG